MSKAPALITVIVLMLLSSCGPKSVTSDRETLSQEARSWIPFSGQETLKYASADDTLIFTGQGKNSWFEDVLYMTDQSSLISLQTDYFAELEREELTFESTQTQFSIHYKLSRHKGDTGDWEIIEVSMSDGIYYENRIKVVINETDNTNKGELYKHRSSFSAGGVTYNDVYYLKQERRPYELFYTPTDGVIAFKLSSNQLFYLTP
ncbi:MAG: hypothetical protein Kow00127_21910 [Bacteroidales bacterium]